MVCLPSSLPSTHPAVNHIGKQPTLTMAAFFQRGKPQQSPQQQQPPQDASYRRSTAYTTDQVKELLDLFPEAAHLRTRLEQQHHLESLFQDTLDYLADELGNSHKVVTEFLKRRTKAKKVEARSKVQIANMKVRFQDDEARALKYLEDQCLIPQHKQNPPPRRREKQRADTPFVPKDQVNKLSQGLLDASSCQNGTGSASSRGRSTSPKQRHPRQESRDRRSPADSRRLSSSPRQSSEDEVRDGPSPVRSQQHYDPGMYYNHHQQQQQQHQQQQRVGHSGMVVNYAEDDAHLSTHPRHKKEGPLSVHNNSDRSNARHRSKSPKRKRHGHHFNEDDQVGIHEIRERQVSWDVADRQGEEDHFSGIPTIRSRSLSPRPRDRSRSHRDDIARQRSLSVGSHHSRDGNHSEGLTSILSHAPRYQTKPAPVLKQQRPICMDPLDHGHGERYPHSLVNSPSRSRSRSDSPGDKKNSNNYTHSPEQRQRRSKSTPATKLENQVYIDEEERFIRERLARSRLATPSNPILVASVSSSSLDRFDAVPTMTTESSYEYQHQQQQAHVFSADGLTTNHSSSFEGNQHRRHLRYPKKEETWVTPIVEFEELPMSPISSTASSVSVLDVKLDTITGSNHSWHSGHQQQHHNTEDMLRQSRSIPLMNNSSSMASSDPTSMERQRSNAPGSQNSFLQGGPQKHESSNHFSHTSATSSSPHMEHQRSALTNSQHAYLETKPQTHESIGKSRGEHNNLLKNASLTSSGPPMNHQRSAASSDHWLLEEDNRKHPLYGISSVPLDPLVNASSLTSYYNTHSDHQGNAMSGSQHYAETETLKDASLRSSNSQPGSFVNASRSNSSKSVQRQGNVASSSYQPGQSGSHTRVSSPGYLPVASPMYQDTSSNIHPSVLSAARVSVRSMSSLSSMSEAQRDIHQQLNGGKSRSTGTTSRAQSSYQEESIKQAVTRAPPFPESGASTPKNEMTGLKARKAPSHPFTASHPHSTSDVYDLDCPSSDGSLSSLIHSIKESAHQTSSKPRQKPRSDPPASASYAIISTRDIDDRSAYGPSRDPIQKTAKPQRGSRKSRSKEHRKKTAEQSEGTVGHSNSVQPIKKRMDPPSVKTRKTIEPPSGNTKQSRKSRSGKKKSQSNVLGPEVVYSSAASSSLQNPFSGNSGSFSSRYRSIFLAPRVQSANKGRGVRPGSYGSSMLGSKRFDIRSRDSDESSGHISREFAQQSRDSSGIKSLLRAASSGDDEPSRKEKLLTSKPTERTNTTTGVLYSQKRDDGTIGTRMIRQSDSTISTLSENHEFFPQQQHQGHVLSFRERYALYANKSENTDNNKTPSSRQIKPMESYQSGVLNWAATNQSSVMFGKPSSSAQLVSHTDDDEVSLNSNKSGGSESSSSTAIEEIIARCQRKLVYNRAPKRN